MTSTGEQQHQYLEETAGMHHRGKFVVLVEVRKLDCMRDLNLGPSKKKQPLNEKHLQKKQDSTMATVPFWQFSPLSKTSKLEPS